MKTIKHYLAIFFILMTIVACSNSKSPGPLEGKWQMSGVVPMTVTFRDGETEALGMIDKVSYKIEGKDVLVTYLDGMAKGTTMRYTITGKDSVHTELGSLQRIK